MSRNRIEVKIEELLEYMNLSERAKESVKNLSKGMRMKLAIARALMHDPARLVLEEPASGLDPEAQVMVRETLAKLAKEGRTNLLSSHNLSDVEEIASVTGIINTYLGVAIAVVISLSIITAVIALFWMIASLSLSGRVLPDNQGRAFLVLLIAGDFILILATLLDAVLISTIFV